MNVVAVHDVTPTQLAMLTASKRDTVFSAQVAIDLVGAVDPAAVRAAWNLIQARHPILRTGFAQEADGTWLQFVVDDVAAAFSELPGPADLACHMERDLNEAFDLRQPGLIRVACAPLGTDRVRLAITHNHAIMDGWSLQLLLAEWLEVIAAQAAQAVPRLEPAAGFGTYVDWLAARDQAAAAAFWKTTLGDVPSPPSLLRRSQTGGGTGEASGAPTLSYYESALGVAAAQTIQSVARRWKITPAALIHGLWALTVGHLLDFADSVFGSTQSGRPPIMPGADRIVGPFLVTLPFRAPPQGPGPAADWFKAVAARLAETHAQGALDPVQIRHAARLVPLAVPLFETVVAVQNYASGQARLDGGTVSAELSGVQIAGGEGKHPLLLGVALGEVFKLRFAFDRRRMCEADVALAAPLLGDLVAALADDASLALSALKRVLRDEPRGAWKADEVIHTPYVAPIGEEEELVAAVWSELAGRPVGRNEDFFDSGSHSVLALELSAQLSKRARRRVSIEAIYRARNVAGIARELVSAEELGSAAVPDQLKSMPIGDHPFALTELQRAYWIGRDDSMELGGRPSFATLEIALTADIDPDNLRDGWFKLRARHAMLRAVVTADGHQRIPADDSDQAARCWFSARCENPEDHDNLREQLRATIGAVVADATRGPMFALALLTGPGSDRRLLVAYDPIICDAGSLAVLTSELSRLARQPNLILPALEIEFSDYVRGLNDRIAGPEGARDRAYWRGRLPTLPPAPDLPMRPGGASLAANHAFTRRSLQIQPPAWRNLRDLAAQLAVTPTALLIAVYGLVLAEWSRNRHFCINLTLFNRQLLHPDVRGLVGDFTSLTLLDADLRAIDTIVDAARVIHRRLSADLDHRLIDGVEVMRWLSQKSGRAEVMPVVLTSTLGQGAASGTEPQLGEIVSGYGQTPQVSLDCQITEANGALMIWWDSLDGNFPDGLVDTMFASFARALEGLGQLGAEVERPIDLLPRADVERRAAYNTSRAHFEPALLQDGFLRQAALDGDRPALIGAGQTLNYAQVEQISRQLAATVKLVAQPGEPVGILAQCPLEMAVASIAVLRAGRAFVRLSPDWPAARCNAVLTVAGVSLLLVGSGMVTDTYGPALCQHPVSLDLSAPAAPVLVDSETGDGLAYIMFTSGSTGEPKGVAMARHAVVNTIADINARLELTAADRILAVSAPTFDLSIYDLFGALAAGAAAVFLPAAARADPDLWLDALRDQAVTIWNSTPSLMQMLCDRAGMNQQAPPGLRAVLLSGDWIPVDLAARVQSHWPKAKVIGLGGATEAAIWSVWGEIGAPLPDWPSVPYGAPLANQTLDVLDERMRSRPDWAVGNLVIGGDGLAEGYYARPDLTAAAFITHPRSGKRLYRTGDLARFRPDGRLEFLGREDGQVKIRGFRVELGEIEALLMQEPDVTQALALVDGASLQAFVACPQCKTSTPEGLRRMLAARLPSYSVPAAVTIHKTWPLTPHGKIDTAALLASVRPAATLPVTVDPGSDPLVAELQTIVTAVLGRAISVNDDLFGAGMDSVAATQIIARLHTETGRRVPLAAVFAARSIAGLAAAAGTCVPAIGVDQLAGAADCAEPVPATSMQERLWLLDQFMPGDPRYVIPGAIAIAGPLDQAALCGAVAALVQRHLPLRSTLASQNGELIQVLHDPPAAPLVVIDEDTGAETWKSFAQRSFDLAHDLPARFRLLQVGTQAWRLEFAIHHVATDAWSIGVLAQELAQLYSVQRGGEPAPAALPASYRDFAVWNRARERSADMAASARWWRSSLAGLPGQTVAALHLGADEATVVPVTIDQDITLGLDAFAAAQGGTLYMALLGLFAVALHQHGGPCDVLLASSINGREQHALEGLIGCFVNIVPHRIRLSDGPDLATVVARACAAVIEAVPHRELPFERILAAGRSAGAVLDPPFAAMFVLQNAPRRSVSVEGLTFTLPPLDMAGSRYPLHLHLEAGPDGLHGALRAEAGTLPLPQLTALVAEFQNLTRDLIAGGAIPPVATAADPTAPGQAINHSSRLAAMLRPTTGGEAGS